MVNEEKVSLVNLTVFHMDECLDWEGRLLARNDPFNFRTFMENHFYGGIGADLAVPEGQRIFPEPDRIAEIREKIAGAPGRYYPRYQRVPFGRKGTPVQ
jgi:glucosamine-6-phosphate deaminase